MLYARIIGVVLLVIGLILLIFGFQATESITGRLAETLSKTAQNQTLWTLVIGLGLAILGLLLTVFGNHFYDDE